ncbi:MAG: PD-(D/E)XK nuclease family protein [Acidobacteria bacterium]|nr:PD-(D/E)XK nuclease family protein [Acidobacteriota bacterium]
MALPLPSSLSPSKISSFTDCPLAFRFEAIERIPSAPTVATVKGTLVHAALERLMTLEAPARDRAAAQQCLAEARAELPTDPEWIELALPADQQEQFFTDAARLVEAYFAVEDPTEVEPTGLELHLEHTDPTTGMLLRGIIDRLETQPDGTLVVTDYKTGRSPNPRFAQSRLVGVHIYSYLVEQNYDARPGRVQLLFLGDRTIVADLPTDQSTRAIERKVRAVWEAIVTACDRENFQAKPSRLCDWCDYRDFCPAQGGSLELGLETAAALRAGGPHA